MRVAIATESFLPQINGVTNSVLRLAEYLADRGDTALIVAPDDHQVPSSYAGFPVVTIPAVSLPMYQDVKLALTLGFAMDKLLSDFAPDVLHAAAPFLIGSSALAATARLGIPSVAIYQTDVPSYATRYGLSLVKNLAWTRVRDLHSLADLTLAPSTAARDQLLAHGVPRVKLWGRGVDTARFAPTKRDQALHDRWAPAGEVVIGYVGRLAPEKQLADLAGLADLPQTALVIVGDGPSRHTLGDDLPSARFLGLLDGEELATAVASFDLFVHPGELETYGQAIQEAMASGLPVVAPAAGGPIDLVQPGRTGYLYPPGDLTAMTSAVARLVADPAQRQRLGTAGRAWTDNRTWPVICDQLMAHYDEAIATAAHGHTRRHRFGD